MFSRPQMCLETIAEKNWLTESICLFFLGRSRGLRYTATALPRKTRMALPRYRGIRDWHYRATACFMALPRLDDCAGVCPGLCPGTTALPRLACVLAWHGLARLASTAVLLPRYRAFQGTYYRATEPVRYTAYRATAGLR